MESYTTRDVARLLGLSPAQVRSQARAGFLTPHRGPRNSYRFCFQDLIILRAIRELSGASVPPRRIRRALKQLAQRLPLGGGLAALRLAAEGRRVVVQEGDSTWSPESGQIHIEFVSPNSAKPAGGVPSAIARFSSGARLSAAQWLARGEDLEDEDPAAAMNAYLRAVELDPGLADAHVNLGRLLQLSGKIRPAIDHYRRALTLDGPAIAAFNLGTALEELGHWPAAMTAYRQAIQMDQNCADAHFNLSRLYELAGRRDTALRHLREYQRLVP